MTVARNPSCACAASENLQSVLCCCCCCCTTTERRLHAELRAERETIALLRRAAGERRPMVRLVGNARCNVCRTHKPETTAFDVVPDGSAAVLVCDDCLGLTAAHARVREVAERVAVETADAVDVDLSRIWNESAQKSDWLRAVIDSRMKQIAAILDRHCPVKP